SADAALVRLRECFLHGCPLRRHVLRVDVPNSRSIARPVLADTLAPDRDGAALRSSPERVAAQHIRKQYAGAAHQNDWASGDSRPLSRKRDVRGRTPGSSRAGHACHVLAPGAGMCLVEDEGDIRLSMQKTAHE